MAIVSYKPAGRYGNALFQMFTAYAYSLEHGIEFSSPLETNNQQWNPIYFPEFKSDKWNKNEESIVIREKEYFKYDQLEWKEEWRGRQIVLDGYFQNIQYFDKYKKEIKDKFRFNLSYAPHHVSIHCRRGDYLTIPDKHVVPDKEWYEKAMLHFKYKTFVFHSDNIKWCKENFGERKDCIFMERGDEISDLGSIIQCGHHINSSSTFSWMGAYLSNNIDKKIITPSRWMTERASNQWTDEMILKEWIRL